MTSRSFITAVAFATLSLLAACGGGDLNDDDQAESQADSSVGAGSQSVGGIGGSGVSSQGVGGIGGRGASSQGVGGIGGSGVTSQGVGGIGGSGITSH
jgi:hypothetical protein